MTFHVNLSMNRNATLVVFNVDSKSSSDRPPEFNQWIIASLEKGEFVQADSFSISVFSFLSSLRSLAHLQEYLVGFQLNVVDDRINRLIEKYKSEAMYLEDYRTSTIGVNTSDLLAKLHEGNFRRANTLSGDQLRDVSRMARLSHSANFSVPGAGKTTALLAVHVYERQMGRVDSLIVVAPRNALGSWQIEVEKCLGATPVTRLTGGRDRVKALLSTNPAIATISYQQLRTTADVLALHLSQKSVHLVLDEAHRAKAGMKSQQGEAALVLSPLAERRDILTGTPMPQGISDIESQISFLWPGQEVFNSSRELQEQVAEAKEAIRPLYVRTRKSELGLPPIKFLYHAVDMDSWQKSIYGLLTKKMADQFANLSIEDEYQLRRVGRQIMKNILFCADPEIFRQSLTAAPELREIQKKLEIETHKESSKLLFLDELLGEVLSRQSEKVVIWSSFTAVIEKLTARYSSYGATFIHGGVETSEEAEEGSREWVIERFHDDASNRVLIANPAACGEGISLHHAAHNAVYFDRNFNAAHYLQSIDRIHRRGLPEGVETRVHVLSLKGSIEEIIRDRLSQKVKALEVLLDDPDLVAMVYDPEDMTAMDQDESGFDQQDAKALVDFLSEFRK